MNDDSHTPTTLDDLRSIGLSERDALVAAAILPHLPDGEVLARIRDEEAPPDMGSPYGDLADFEDRVPTVGATANLFRVAVEDEELTRDYTRKVTPRPHSIRSYELSLYDVDLLRPPDGGDVDFSDTDQTSLSRFGVRSTVLDFVDPVASDGGERFERKPHFPA